MKRISKILMFVICTAGCVNRQYNDTTSSITPVTFPYESIAFEGRADLTNDGITPTPVQTVEMLFKVTYANNKAVLDAEPVSGLNIDSYPPFATMLSQIVLKPVRVLDRTSQPIPGKFQWTSDQTVSTNGQETPLIVVKVKDGVVQGFTLAGYPGVVVGHPSSVTLGNLPTQ